MEGGKHSNINKTIEKQLRNSLQKMYTNNSTFCIVSILQIIPSETLMSLLWNVIMNALNTKKWSSTRDFLLQCHYQHRRLIKGRPSTTSSWRRWRSLSATFCRGEACGSVSLMPQCHPEACYGLFLYLSWYTSEYLALSLSLSL